MTAESGVLRSAMLKLPRMAELPVVMGVVAIVGLLVLPLPTWLLDLLLALSIASALVVLLTSLYTERPLDFSVFPSLLLLLTLFRLALNVSSTRLILGQGDAGSVIDAFGAFVIGGNYAVGVVIFLILVAINFIVITKGAGRVAEVAARFTLDAMPGRQMSIDGDLSAGLIDDTEARRRRDEVSQEADFYGAMDGAAKFVRGDAIAGLLITAINIVGGIFIGVVQRGMPMTRALSEYTVLTVGDGLVTQIPALVISTAAGIMVTSSSSRKRVSDAVIEQVGRQTRPMWIASGFLGLIALVPGLPTIPFLALAGGAAMGARRSAVMDRKSAGALPAATAVEEVPATERTPVQDLLQIDPVELEIGYALIPLVDESQGGDLLERIRLLRKQAALELGILIPPIRIRDDVRFTANEYIVKIRGTEVARGEVMPRLLLALDTGGVIQSVDGMDTVDPSFGMPARWVSQPSRVDAEANGYVVVEPSTVVATHLMETLKANAAELLGRQDVQEMVDTLKETYPALVEEVVPGKIPLGVMHRVLQTASKGARAAPRPGDDPRDPSRPGGRHEGSGSTDGTRAQSALERHRRALSRRPRRGPRHHGRPQARSVPDGVVQPPPRSGPSERDESGHADGAPRPARRTGEVSHGRGPTRTTHHPTGHARRDPTADRARSALRACGVAGGAAASSDPQACCHMGVERCNWRRSEVTSSTRS